MICKICGTSIKQGNYRCEVCGTVQEPEGTTVLSGDMFESESYIAGADREPTFSKKIAYSPLSEDNREEVQAEAVVPEQIKRVEQQEVNDLQQKKEAFYRKRARYREEQEKEKRQRVWKRRMRIIIPVVCLMTILMVIILKLSVKEVDYNAINQQIYNCDVGKTNTFYYQNTVSYYETLSGDIVSCNEITGESRQIPVTISGQVVRAGRLGYQKHSYYLSLLVEDEGRYAVNIYKINARNGKVKELCSTPILDADHIEETELVFYLWKNNLYMFERDTVTYHLSRVSLRGRQTSLTDITGEVLPNMVDGKVYAVSENGKGIYYIDVDKGSQKTEISKGLTVSREDGNTIVGDIARIYAAGDQYYVFDEDNRLYVIYKDEDTYGEGERQVVSEILYADEVMQGAEVSFGDGQVQLDSTSGKAVAGYLHGIPELEIDGEAIYMRMIYTVTNDRYCNGLIEIDTEERVLGGESIFGDEAVRNIDATLDVGVEISDGVVWYYTGTALTKRVLAEYQQPYGISQARVLYSTIYDDYYQEKINEQEYRDKLNANMIYDPIGYVYYMALSNEEQLSILQGYLNSGDYIAGYKLARQMLETVAMGTDKYSQISEIQERCYEQGKTAYIAELKDRYRAGDVEGYDELKAELHDIYGNDQAALEEMNANIRDFSETPLLSHVSYRGTDYSITYDREAGTVDGCTIVMDYAHPERQYVYGKSYLYYTAPVFSGNVLPVGISVVTEAGVGYSFEMQGDRILAYHQKDVPNLIYAEDIMWQGLDFLYEYNENDQIIGIYSSSNGEYRYSYEYDDAGRIIRESVPVRTVDEAGNIVLGGDRSRTFTYNEDGYLAGWTEGTDMAEIHYSGNGRIDYMTVKEGDNEVKYTFSYNDRGCCSEVVEAYSDGTEYHTIYEYQTEIINPGISAEIR